MTNEIYLYPPGLVCCAGGTRGSFFQAALDGYKEGLTIDTDCAGLKNGKKYPVGLVHTENLPTLHGIYDTRLLRITDAALEQIKDDVEYAKSKYGADRIACCIGTCNNGTEWSEPAHEEYFKKGHFPKSYDLSMQNPGTFGCWAAKKFGITGQVLTITNACASSAAAIVKAAQLIKAGFADAVIAGGADIAANTIIAGFDSLKALSPEQCNPFSRNRKGINLGEAAAFFLLCKDPPQNSPPIKLLGYGESSDGYHITAPRPDGSGSAQAMRTALKNASLMPEHIAYINLHGTGTEQNDAMEARAVAEVFGSGTDGTDRTNGKRLPLVSSTKPVTGHTLGAAGSIELALCWCSLYNQKNGETAVPMHCWDALFDETLPSLSFAPPAATVKKPIVMMSNSFAFGGCNVSLIVGAEF
ncbi:beta-ketoacyl-[acyl-carrier-protein] synthase II [Spirochaetia bacterium]|nr:beta-ketoacyl-[acyl-carrier-protein] synthase II [Spirochaetia bacterium]